MEKFKFCCPVSLCFSSTGKRFLSKEMQLSLFDSSKGSGSWRTWDWVNLESLSIGSMINLLFGGARSSKRSQLVQINQHFLLLGKCMHKTFRPWWVWVRWHFLKQPFWRWCWGSPVFFETWRALKVRIQDLLVQQELMVIRRLPSISYTIYKSI